ncbi:FAD-dependent monooxygenase [Amycolatopsis sp. CA-230715]|uniref:FAD-dependent monooxygenase n=1 Tax=Amycolatopsis sp. CA-230715 TaxID=2745196 RepID=UPI001C0135EB|nr:FAD-dependent monooxygenase [Amycolatopsis sp. CA-230715]QWF77605.1 hypothetical protein HUW46_00997 [Amycolatopsis sp. CA-230715]
MDYAVVVAGGGPVGLMLACELRLGGARVAVVERLTEVAPTFLRERNGEDGAGNAINPRSER